MRIYHLVLPAEWEKVLNSFLYRPESLKTEGFIHCSTYEQLLETAARHFADQEELVVLELLEKKVKDILRWEASHLGEEFPHLYGKLTLSQVNTTHMIYRNQRGDWVWGD